MINTDLDMQVTYYMKAPFHLNRYGEKSASNNMSNRSKEEYSVIEFEDYDTWDPEKESNNDKDSSDSENGFVIRSNCTIQKMNSVQDETCIGSEPTLSKTVSIVSNTNKSSSKYSTFTSIKDYVENFLKEYPVVFPRTTFKTSKNKLRRMLDEKYAKITQINSNYNSQIKEIDLIATKDDYDKNSHLKEIIDSLIEEKKSEIKKVEESYDKLIDDYQGELEDSSNERMADQLCYNLFKEIACIYDVKK